MKKTWKTKYLHLKMYIFKNVCCKNSKEYVILVITINNAFPFNSRIKKRRKKFCSS